MPSPLQLFLTKMTANVSGIVIIFLLLFDFTLSAPSNGIDATTIIPADQNTTIEHESAIIKAIAKISALSQSEKTINKTTAPEITTSKPNTNQSTTSEIEISTTTKSTNEATTITPKIKTTLKPQISKTNTRSNPTTTLTTSTTTTTTTTTKTTTRKPKIEVGRDAEEVACESETEQGNGLLRNGIGDNSYFIWPDRRIPYTIDPTFNEESVANINDAINNYNELFADCIQWTPRKDEVTFGCQIRKLQILLTYWVDFALTLTEIDFSIELHQI